MGISTMDKKKKERLDKICGAINKTKSEAIQYMGGNELHIERFPSGHPKLDLALGGGWPIGRFVELYGPESGGKTTTCLHAIAEFQKKFPSDLVAMIDTEFSFDPVYASALGVKTEELLVSQPESAEESMGLLRNLIELGVKLIVVDSIAAMCPQAELNGEIGDSHVATLARVMTSSMKILTGLAAKSGTTVFWTNQMREKIGVTYGAKTGTPGGRAIKHHMSVRVKVAKVGVEKDGDTIVSSKTKISVEKNKTAPPFKVADVSIVYGYGFDLVAGIFDMALQKKIVKKTGGWFAYGEVFKIQGRYNVLEELRENKELFKEFEKAVADVDLSDTAEEVPVESGVKLKKIKKKESPVVRKAVSEGDNVDVGVDDV
jgi:recombination protein RecA